MEQVLVANDFSDQALRPMLQVLCSILSPLR